MAEGFRTFDHTGDLGLEVWADSPERLFGHAAEALMAQVAVSRAPEPSEVETEVRLEGKDAEDLLVHWLNTVLLEADLHRALWTQAEVETLSATAITGRLRGPRLDSDRQEFLREIKAVSHHFLALELTPPDCRCRVILDL